MTTLPFYIFLFIHLTSLIVGFGAVMVIDCFGLLWLLGRVKLSFVSSVANVTQRLIWLGWGGLVASGIVLAVIKGHIDELTQIKLFFVLMLGVNGILMHLLKKRMDALGDADTVPRSVLFRMFFSSTLSQIGWWGAMLIGFLHNHWQHRITWPPHPLIVIGVLAVVMCLVGVIGYSQKPYPTSPSIEGEERRGF